MKKLMLFALIVAAIAMAGAQPVKADDDCGGSWGGDPDCPQQ